MHIDGAHPIVKKSVKDYLLDKKLTVQQRTYDTDNIIYVCSGSADSKNVELSMKCPAWEQIKASGGVEILKEKFPEWYTEETIHGAEFNVNLSIPRSVLPSALHMKKEWTEEQK